MKTSFIRYIDGGKIGAESSRRRRVTFDLTFKVGDLAVVVATLLGPVLAGRAEV